MEDLRDSVLDDVCVSLAEIRATKAELEQAEDGHLGTAMRRMRQLAIWSFLSHGIELARIQGEEKIRCRVTKVKAIAVTQVETEPVGETSATGDVVAMDAEQTG